MTGNSIATARRAKGLSVRVFARRLQISHSHLCDIEHERRKPAHDLALRIAKFLELPAPDAVDDMVRTAKLPRHPTVEEAVEIAGVLGIETTEAR